MTRPWNWPGSPWPWRSIFKAPQDIEWCIDRDGRIFILQSRPLKQMAGRRRESEPCGSGLDNPDRAPGRRTGQPRGGGGPGLPGAEQPGPACSFPEGAVLVTAFPHPSWATLLSRAAAVVTDRGGITGHLANVAREFGIPALFNTGEATARLTPGEMITVDADGLAVYQGRVEALLKLAAPRQGLMAGTPVGETLKEVMTFITPLNLTNPEAPDFRPRGCRTLHDITRFAHEVSVKEMFAFDKTPGLLQIFHQAPGHRRGPAVVGPEPGRRLQGGGGRANRWN